MQLVQVKPAKIGGNVDVSWNNAIYLRTTAEIVSTFTYLIQETGEAGAKTFTILMERLLIWTLVNTFVWGRLSVRKQEVDFASNMRTMDIQRFA